MRNAGYALTGILLLLTPRFFFSAAAVVTLLTLIVRHASWRLHIPLDGFFFDGGWLMFAAGIAVYYGRNYAVRKQIWFVNAALVAGIAYSLRTAGHGVERELLWAFSFALLISLTHRWDSSLSSSRLLRPLRFSGTICYSLYLVHAPIARGISELLYRQGVRSDAATLFITVPLCLLVSVAAGWAFHLAVERRFLNAPRS